MASEKNTNFALKLGLAIGIPILLVLTQLNAKASKHNAAQKEYIKKVFKGYLKNKTLAERIKDLEPEVKPRVQSMIDDLKKENWKLAIVVYKKEREMQLWTDGKNRKKLRTYRMTNFSGKLGPKNKQGDKQIPEGIYRTTHLNPNSSYFLSIGLNYPNDNDRKRAKQNKISDPGGDIFIHGRDVTIGCVAVGDHWIEEVFYLVHRAGASKVKVLIAPSKLPLPNFKELGLNPDSELLARKYSNLSAELTDFKESN